MANNQFGDFQTNSTLAGKVVHLVRNLANKPQTIVEPTCGKGSFIRASREAFPDAVIHGLEIQSDYIKELEKQFQFDNKFILHRANYFDFDWCSLFERMAKPVWVIGNPPWVTNSQLVKLESNNLPRKSPQAHLTGFEAQTGKSNFDISESMIRDWFNWCASCEGSLAVICKTSVARKVLQWWWKRGLLSPHAGIYLIDAQAEFGATVSACVLVCSFTGEARVPVCNVYASLSDSSPSGSFGFLDGHLVSDATAYLRGRSMLGNSEPRWRSGIKHDAGSVLEFVRTSKGLVNKLGEKVDLEPIFLYPLLKGSDLARDRAPHRALLVPQRMIGEDTSRIQREAPLTWKYLSSHADRFAARKSVIYQKGGPFSIFGIGEYTFKPWKVAIGALYKRLKFHLVPPENGRPVVFDDTIYFLSFHSEEEARHVLEKLHSPAVQDFIQSMIFWDDMRPVKTEILNRIGLGAVQEPPLFNGTRRDQAEGSMSFKDQSKRRQAAN